MRSLINDGYPFRHDQCLSLGLPGHVLRRYLACHRVRKVFVGAYVDAAIPDSRWLRVNSVRLVTPPHAVVADCFASWLLGVDAFRPSERHSLRPTLIVPHGASRVRLPDVRCRQAILDPRDIVEMEDILVTAPLRTTSDLLRRLWRPYALAAGDGMARAVLVDSPQIVDYVDELRGFRGGPQARELAPLIDPKAESPGESWQRMRIIDAGLPRPETQIHVVDEFGRDRYFDMGYREQLVASEYDGREFHTAEEDTTHDRDRRSYFERRYGWRFSIGRRESIFGDDTTFETELGSMLGIEPRPRRW
ncbi:MAG: hypothetical protein ACRDO8_10880 [Nocardioidaceae bacterium]